MSALKEALSEGAKAMCEIGEFEITSLKKVIQKTREILTKATEEEKPEIQQLLEVHIKHLAKKEETNSLFKLMSQITEQAD